MVKAKRKAPPKRKATKKVAKRGSKRKPKVVSGAVIVDETIIGWCANKMILGGTVWVVKRALREYIEEHHDGRHVDPKTIEKIMSAARVKNAARVNVELDRLRQLQLKRYTAFVEDPDCPENVRLKAAERIDELIGVSAKFNPGGDRAESPEAKAARAREAMREFKSTAELAEEEDS